MSPPPSQRRRPISLGPGRPGFFRPGPVVRQRPAPQQRPSSKRPAQPQRLASARPVPVARQRQAPPMNRGGPLDFLRAFGLGRQRQPVHAGKHGSKLGHALGRVGERLVHGKQRVADPGDKRMEALARDTRGWIPVPKTNPMYGTENEWRVSDFVKESWAEINRSTKFTNDPQKKFVAEFKMAVVSAIGQGQIQSVEQLHEFIQEFGKQQGMMLDSKIVEEQLFNGKKEKKQLGEIFSSYEKMARYRKTG